MRGRKFDDVELGFATEFFIIDCIREEDIEIIVSDYFLGLLRGRRD